MHPSGSSAFAMVAQGPMISLRLLSRLHATLSPLQCLADILANLKSGRMQPAEHRGGALASKCLKRPLKDVVNVVS